MPRPGQGPVTKHAIKQVDRLLSNTGIDVWESFARWIPHQIGAQRDGLALRHDHGSNFMADHFQKLIRFWRMAPSYAFVREPETNGVIERFFRTLKEQAIHGHVFQTIDEVRHAVRAFAARYNAEWLIEKNGYLSPLDARAVWLDTCIRRAA